MRQLVYKVAVLIDGEFKSILHETSSDKDMVVTYTGGKKAYPRIKGSYLFAFNDLRSAAIFKEDMSTFHKRSDFYIFIAEADVVEKEAPLQMVFIDPFDVATTSRLSKYWSEIFHGVYSGDIRTHNKFKYTKYCRWIKLIRPVTTKDFNDAGINPYMPGIEVC